MGQILKKATFYKEDEVKITLVTMVKNSLIAETTSKRRWDV